MDLERYSAKMMLVPWDMMCDRTDRRTGEQNGQEDRRTERTGEQENRTDRRTERIGGKKYRRKEIQEERNTGGKKYRK